MKTERILSGNKYEIRALVINNANHTRLFLEQYAHDSQNDFAILWGKLKHIAENGTPSNPSIFKPIKRGKGLFEIKNKRVRLFGFFHGRGLIIVTHGWMKQGKGQDNEIKKALKYKRQFEGDE